MDNMKPSPLFLNMSDISEEYRILELVKISNSDCYDEKYNVVERDLNEEDVCESYAIIEIKHLVQASVTICII